jgi:hypothetical protein
MVLVEIGGRVVKCHPLSMQQNLVCILFGFGELIWGFVIKKTPLSWWQCIQMSDDIEEEDDEEDGEKSASITYGLKKSSTLRK